MRPTFAIFTTLPDGRPFWIESVETLEADKSVLKGSGSQRSGQLLRLFGKERRRGTYHPFRFAGRLSPHASHTWFKKDRRASILRHAGERRKLLPATPAPTNLPHR